MTFGAVILAGGQSRRMGRDKAMLEVDGHTFIQRLAGELSGFQELLLSVDSPERYPELALPRVVDEFEGLGPMGGLYSALGACRSEALLAVSCDLPLFRRELGEKLRSCLEPGIQAVVPVTGDGRLHPLCAVYHRNCREVFLSSIKEGNYRLRDALKRLSVRYFEPGDFSRLLLNVNTPEEYKALGLKGDAVK